PAIHAGLLAIRDNSTHMETLGSHGIQPIDMVVCNLYPFETTVCRPGSTHEEIVENIDIGGPTMIRAAAKNYSYVAVVSDASQYPAIVKELQSTGSLARGTRMRLAAAAFARIAQYDQAISKYFVLRGEQNDLLPASLDLHFERRSLLRYGENPHQ